MRVDQMSGTIPIDALEAVTGKPVGRIFEAGIISWPGAVLVIPLALIGGDLARLQHELGCPVADVLDTMQKARPIPLEEAIGGLWPGPGSQFDVVRELVAHTGHPGAWWVAASESVGKRIFTHDCGVRLGLINDLVDKGIRS